MQDKIQNIITNQQSGSHEIVKSALHVLKEYLETNNEREKNLFCDGLSNLAKELTKPHKNIVILHKNTGAVLYYFKRLVKSDKDINDIKLQTIKKINDLIQAANRKEDRIGSLAARLIFNQNNILTISSSSIIKKILITARKINRNFDIFCLESRPLLEGHKFALELAKNGLMSTVITEAMMGNIMPEINMVISGADRLYESGFINKIGTLPLAIIAQKYNVPFYVAAETDKILKEINRSIRFYPKKADEVFKTRVRKVSVLNYHFEKIPFEYVSKIICEEGVFETHEFIKWYLKD